MDGEAIYSALLSNAATAQLSPSPSPTPKLSQSGPVPTTLALYGNDQGERIYKALLAAAMSSNLNHSTIDSTGSPLLPATRLSALASTNDTTSIATMHPGFVTSRVTSLPSAVSILVGAFLILLSLSCLVVGARSIYFGRDLGRTYGSNERKGWLRGGVGGIFFGSTALGLLVTLLTLLIVSRQNEASLGAWATIAIVVLCSLPGAIAGGRWAWVSRSSLAVIGSSSLSLLLITSFHISSTLTRLILTIVFFVLSSLAVHLRFTQRFAIPILSALSGSFLLILGIDIFVHLGFIDSLGLLINSNGVGANGGEAEHLVVEWYSSRGKGLIAGWWLSTIASGVWQGWWGLGIEGQELWNDYLARYLPTLDPLGTHFPPLTFTERIRALFSSKRKTTLSSNRHERFTKFSNRSHHQQRRTTPWDDIEDEEDDKDDEFDYEKGLARIDTTTTTTTTKESRRGRQGSDTWDSEVETLASRRKSHDRPPTTRSSSSKPARYGQVDSSEEDENGDDNEKDGIWSAGKGMDSKNTKSFGALSEGRDDFRKVMTREESKNSPTSFSPTTTMNHSSHTLSDIDQHHLLRREEEKRGSLFSKMFRNNSSRPSSSSLSPPQFITTTPKLPSSSSSHRHNSDKTRNSVPATPSLITAIQRVNAAQKQARELERVDSTRLDPADDATLDDRRTRRASMDEFWKSVVEKAGSNSKSPGSFSSSSSHRRDDK